MYRITDYRPLQRVCMASTSTNCFDVKAMNLELDGSLYGNLFLLFHGTSIDMCTQKS